MMMYAETFYGRHSAQHQPLCPSKAVFNDYDLPGYLHFFFILEESFFEVNTCIFHYENVLAKEYF